MATRRRFDFTRADAIAFVGVTLAPVIFWLACWPFAEGGVNDDFGYAHVVKRLLETGRLQYNGWCAPILGAQAAWGAAFAAIFGSSHDVMRLSTLPLAMACAAVRTRCTVASTSPRDGRRSRRSRSSARRSSSRGRRRS